MAGVVERGRDNYRARHMVGVCCVGVAFRLVPRLGLNRLDVDTRTPRKSLLPRQSVIVAGKNILWFKISLALILWIVNIGVKKWLAR